MRFWTLCLLIVLLTVVSSEQLEDQQTSLQEDPARTTQSGRSTTPPTTEDEFSFTDNGIPKEILKDNKDDNFDKTLDDMLIFESFIGDDKAIEENPKSLKENDEKPDDTQSISENTDESKVSSDLIEVRRQGDQITESKTENSASSAQFDDSKQAGDDSQPQYGQRKSKQRVQDGVPLLQLTEGGYTRPYKRPSFRNRYASRQDSSEQSSRVQEPDENSDSNKKPERRPIPKVTYTPRLEAPEALGPRQTLNPGFAMPNRNNLPVHHVVPTTIPSRFFNTPGVFPDYTANPFQAQFPPNNDVGLFSNFVRDPNNVALYQASQSNPFQAPQLLFQNNPEVQTQPYVIEPPRNFPPQFQQNNLNAPRVFENGVENAGPSYPSYLSNPPQFQIPPNFYSTPRNGANAFNSPAIRFLPNYPNTGDALSSPQFFRYPVTTDAQNNQQNTKDQNLDSEASQEENNSKAPRPETVYPRNRDDASTVRFGTRLQAQNDDVYMRYPTNEAGYATPENLPPQNNSEEAKDNGQQTSSEQRNIQNADSRRNGLNSARPNQRINNSYGFPPEIFGDVPLDFGYQRPQNQILTSDRNRGRPDFESRNFFNPLESLPGNNYQFLNLDVQRRGHRVSDGTPSCAKQNNVSYCFEDREYPKNDILYSLNSNAFLADRLAGPEVQLNAITLVDRNSTEEVDQDSENYACSADIKYGSPMRGKNLAGVWKIIVNVEGKLSQPVRMEVCRSLGDACNIGSNIKTACVQKYSIQRLLAWIPGTGIHSDVFKIPVACSCQILEPTRR